MMATQTLLEPGYATINFENGHTIRVMVREAVLVTDQIPIASIEEVNPRWIPGSTRITLSGEVDESLVPGRKIHYAQPRCRCGCLAEPADMGQEIPIRVRRGSE